MNDTGLGSWAEGYLDYLVKVCKRNSRSLADIRCTVKRVTLYMKDKYPTKNLWDIDFNSFLKWINEERESGRSIKTIAKDLSHIRSFINYMLRNERCERNVLDGFYLQDDKEVMPDFLELDEVERLISILSVKGFEDRRNRMMIIILYGCGLRTKELCSLDIKDIDSEHQELHIRHAKGDLERQVPVPDAVWTELLAYLSERNWKQGPLFRTSTKHRRMSGVVLGKILFDFAIKAGIDKKVTPKTLRHSFATHLMDRGVDLSIIASLMGHSSPRETGVYLHQLKGKKEKAIQSMNIFNKKGGI